MAMACLGSTLAFAMIAATRLICVCCCLRLRDYSHHCRSATTTAIPLMPGQVCMNYIDLLVTAASVVELVASQMTMNPMLFRDSPHVDLAL